MRDPRSGVFSMAIMYIQADLELSDVLPSSRTPLTLPCPPKNQAELPIPIRFVRLQQVDSGLALKPEATKNPRGYVDEHVGFW